MRFGALGDPALELLLLRRLEERVAVLEGLREPDRAVAPVEQAVEQLAPLGQREVEQRLPVQLEQVEEVVDDRRSALLHEREARPALLVDRADLAVNDAVRRAQRLRELLRDAREALGVVLVLTR